MALDKVASDKRKNAFLHELIELQVKHEVILEGYDMSVWTKELGEDACQRHTEQCGQFVVTEQRIREAWDDERLHLIE